MTEGHAWVMREIVINDCASNSEEDRFILHGRYFGGGCMALSNPTSIALYGRMPGMVRWQRTGLELIGDKWR